MFNVCVGFLGTFLVDALALYESKKQLHAALSWIFRLFPIYCLGNSALEIVDHVADAEEYDVGPLSGEVFGGCVDVRGECLYLVGDDFFMMTVCFFLWLFLLFFIDVVLTQPSVKSCFKLHDPMPPASGGMEDEMVVEEKRRVADLNPSEQLLWVKNLRKVYNRRLHAVRGISFAAATGQVFGLLGVNGAGKTTTFKMICGQVEPSGGEVRIQGLDVSTQIHQVRKIIGYCPQFDALLDNLTVMEHLYLYGRIKGLSGKSLNTEVEKQTKELDLLSFADSRAGSLSGGNKRKLSVAMAVVGEPPLLFLDEPSAGMDPVARRSMWSVVENISERRHKSVVILTTHSMDEADALCARIAIQVDGRFRCLGNGQQIKSKYGEGLELSVKIVSPSMLEVEELSRRIGGLPSEPMLVSTVISKLRGGVISEASYKQVCAVAGSPLLGATNVQIQIHTVASFIVLQERILTFEAFLHKEFSVVSNGSSTVAQLEKTGPNLRYQILPAALRGKFQSLSAVFSLLQEHREEYKVEDFQISQTSLEQVFNRFASTREGQAPSPAAVPTLYGVPTHDPAPAEP
jgi:ABC-type multidrug transport system ATPase subunit